MLTGTDVEKDSQLGKRSYGIWCKAPQPLEAFGVTVLIDKMPLGVHNRCQFFVNEGVRLEQIPNIIYRIRLFLYHQQSIDVLANSRRKAQ